VDSSSNAMHRLVGKASLERNADYGGDER